MNITISCPYCEQQIEVDENTTEEFLCPGCSESVQLDLSEESSNASKHQSSTKSRQSGKRRLPRRFTKHGRKVADSKRFWRKFTSEDQSDDTAVSIILFLKKFWGKHTSEEQFGFVMVSVILLFVGLLAGEAIFFPGNYPPPSRNIPHSSDPTSALIDRQANEYDKAYMDALGYSMKYQEKTGRTPTTEEIQEYLDSR